MHGMEEAPALVRYTVAVHRGRDSYFARVMQVPGCVARGASEVEAVENVRAALRAYLWVAQVFAADRAAVELEIRA
jgi:predicted RNase H-like HicB family nuclease